MIFVVRYIVLLNICIHKMYSSCFFYKVIYKLYGNNSYKFSFRVLISYQIRSII